MSTAKWTLDPAHTLVEFSVKHMMIATVKGRFTGIEGEIEADPADLTTANISASVSAAGIDTREEQRDGHLRSADFFDAENHPKLTFASKQVRHTGKDEYAVTGDLTIRGITREVTFKMVYEGTGKDPWGNQRIGLSIVGKVNRKDWNLTWNVALEAGGFLVGEEVRIEIQIQAVRAASGQVA